MRRGDPLRKWAPAIRSLFLAGGVSIRADEPPNKMVDVIGDYIQNLGRRVKE